MSSTTNIVKHIVNGGKYLLYFSLYLNFLFSTDYLILTNNNLLEAASKISNIYSNSSTEYYLETEIIIVDTLNVEISDFINSKIENNENLKYLLIIGDENNFPILTKSVNCNEISDEFPTDDLYSSLGENHPPRLSTGRIPASNLNEALNLENTKVLLFGKTTAKKGRRMGVVLSSNNDLNLARKNAEEASLMIKVISN